MLSPTRGRCLTQAVGINFFENCHWGIVEGMRKSSAEILNAYFGHDISEYIHIQKTPYEHKKTKEGQKQDFHK